MPLITGRMINEAGNPHVNMLVQAWVYTVIHAVKDLGPPVKTGADGRFSISVDLSNEIRIPGLVTNLHVRALSSVGRILFISNFRQQDQIEQDWPIGDLKVHTNTITGWRITNLDPAGSRAFYSEANNVLPLIDNELAWSVVNQAALVSRQEVNFLNFYLSVDDVRIAFAPGEPKEGEKTEGVRFEKSLLHINQQTNPTKVRILSRAAVVNESVDLELPDWGTMTSARKVEKFFARADNQPNTVDRRKYFCSGRLPMHAKALTMDGVEAYILGSPFDQQYYDSDQHPFDNPRRGLGGNIKAPIHEVSVRIQGSAVPHVHDVFNAHWTFTGGTAVAALPTATPPEPHTPVQIARTLRGDRFKPPFGETGILEAYQRVFEQATDFIYFETQYFVNLRIMAAIRAALKARPKLQIIGCININVDIPFYNGFQRDRAPERERDEIPQLLSALENDGTASRFGLFCLWTHEPRTPKQLLVRNYIHAKVAFADDRWLTIGVANLDGVSLDMSDSYVSAPRSPDAEFSRRATEVNALIFSDFDNPATSPSTLPADFRKALWAEHLGADTDVVTKPQDGWLSLWNQNAQKKIFGLNANPPQVIKSKILKWNTATKAVPFLKGAGVIDPLRFDVRAKIRKFDLDTGEWKG